MTVLDRQHHRNEQQWPPDLPSECQSCERGRRPVRTASMKVFGMRSSSLYSDWLGSTRGLCPNSWIFGKGGSFTRLGVIGGTGIHWDAATGGGDALDRSKGDSAARSCRRRAESGFRKAMGRSRALVATEGGYPFVDSRDSSAATASPSLLLRGGRRFSPDLIIWRASLWGDDSG
jgi:hypothetical protein